MDNFNFINILNIGFYNRKNLGDDALMLTINKILNVTNICIDDVDDIEINNYDIILLGGGDTINPYFINKLISLDINKNIPIYAISVGVPYHSFLENNNVCILDYIFARNNEDYELVKNKLSDKYVNVMHDIVFSLPKYILNLNLNDNVNDFIRIQRHNGKNIISFCLTRPIKANDDYNRLVVKFAILMSRLIENHNCAIICIPFNTQIESDKECDIYLYNDILTCINIKYKKLIFLNMESVNLIDDVYNILRYVDLNICSRFHAHVFSIMTYTPFISLCHTSKVKKMIEEYDLANYCVKFSTDEKDGPTDIDIYDIEYKIEKLLNSRHEYYNYIDKIRKLYDNTIVPELEKSIVSIKELINKKNKRLIFPRLLTDEMIDDKIMEIGTDILKYLNQNINININNLITNKKTIIDYVKNENDKNKLVQLILFGVSKDINNIYYHGLYDQIFNKDYNFRDSIVWLLKDYYNYHKTEHLNLNLNKTFNFHYINQYDSNKVHRSGWDYVLSNLVSSFNGDNGIYFDAYVDRTFLWGSDIMEFKKVIPYTELWTGVIHHTPNDEYTNNNTKKLINNPNFIKSLDTCAGIYVLSDYLKQWLEINLPKKILIEVLCHPTEFVNDEFNFTMSKFMNNPNRKIIQIGAWLRNIYSIYALDSNIQKGALVGKMMNDYYPNEDMDICNHIVQLILNNNNNNNNNNNECICNSICREITKENKYIYFLMKYLTDLHGDYYIDYVVKYYSFWFGIPYYRLDYIIEKKIKQNHDSVTIIKNLNNNDYDKLLSNNIVFLDLIEASACNTLIECIVRNTPILINRIDATVEYLGETYPFFYDTLEEASEKLKSTHLICRTHLYLKNMNKDKFKIDNFIKNIKNSQIYKK
jgi:hypothetical protein